MDQKVSYKVQLEDGTLVDFNKDYKVLRTEIKVWDGRIDYYRVPIAQTGIIITYIVSKGDYLCVNECGFQGYHAEAMTHEHSTYWKPL